MRNKLTKITLAAGIALAMAFTFNGCSSDDGGGGGSDPNKNPTFYDIHCLTLNGCKSFKWAFGESGEYPSQCYHNNSVKVMDSCDFNDNDVELCKMPLEDKCVSLAYSACKQRQGYFVIACSEEDW